MAKAKREIERLREAIKTEADYCQKWADRYTESDPSRAARYQERADRLRAHLYA